MIELLIASGAIAIGIWFIVTDARLCRSGCWLNDATEALLPRELEFLAGGLPWLALGIGLLVVALVRRK